MALGVAGVASVNLSAGIVAAGAAVFAVGLAMESD